MRVLVAVACLIALVAVACNSENGNSAEPPLGSPVAADTPCDRYKNDMRFLMVKAAGLNDEAVAAGEDVAGGAISAPEAAEVYGLAADGIDDLRDEIVELGDPPDAELARPAGLIVDSLGMLAEAHRTTAAGVLDQDDDRRAAGSARAREASISFNEASLMLPEICP